MDVVERLTLEAAAAHSLLALEHLHRYDVAAELCAGDRVVDLCCGTGYGSQVLAGQAVEVLGVDNDVGAIDAAQAAFGGDAVRFEVADAHEFLRRELHEAFDAIVLLEGLEHLQRPDEAVESLKRHASRGMRLVVSLPNSRTLGEENPHHVTDYDHEAVAETFEGFDDVTILYQFLAEGSLVRRADSDGQDARVIASERGEIEYANHFIVCVNCGDRVAAADSGRAQLELAPVHNRYMKNLEAANEELRRTNARLGREWLGKADSAAASLLAKLEWERAELEQLLAGFDRSDPVTAERKSLVSRIEQLHEQVLAQDRQLREMAGTRVWRLAGRYWATRDRVKRLGRRA
jgi:2-polyprenyl-3-methyl-5-hydroxy-6-metoxy-1,4-benzoquinol methylase